MRTLLLAFAVLFCLTTSSLAAEPSATLIDARRIWDAAPHNAFTDLIRYHDQWLCTFREGTGHVPGRDGAIRILRSDDGLKWESAALLTETGIDLRDPKLSIAPDGRLMLLMGGSVYDGAPGDRPRKLVSGRTRVSFSKDLKTWTAPQPVSLPDREWLWRVTWLDEVGYGVAYSHGAAAKDFLVHLWRTRDGVNYEHVTQLKPPCWANETTLRFLPDRTMLALVRGEQSDRHTILGTSQPPYTQWTWVDTGRAAQGPNFLPLPDGRLLYAGRDFPNGARTVVGELRDGRCLPLLTLPSGGDCSYPGLVWHEDTLWVSYYSSHEGKTAIYLARLRLPVPETSPVRQN